MMIATIFIMRTWIFRYLLAVLLKYILLRVFEKRDFDLTGRIYNFIKSSRNIIRETFTMLRNLSTRIIYTNLNSITSSYNKLLTCLIKYR